MLNALSTPAVANAAPPSPPRSSASPAGDEPAADDFAQALDDAAAKRPKGPGRERLRSAARPVPGTEPAKAEPQPMPAIAEGKDRQTLPPQGEADELGAQDPSTPQGLAALLAELRAAVPPASASATAAAQGLTEGGAKTSSALASQSDKRATGGQAIGIGIDSVGAERGPASAAGLPAAGNSREGLHQGMHDGKSENFAQQLAAAAAPDSAAQRIDGVPLPQAAAATITTANATAVQAEARLPAAPGSAEFGPQLGTQISTFVRDGIEHARLHLNPAEMGPVSVQIQLDGQTALVHLSAENAHTRQALEQALPQLAGSLREAGITLSGGGVFEQPRQGDGTQDQAAAGGKPGRNDDVLQADTSPLTARLRGVVDLVA